MNAVMFSFINVGIGAVVSFLLSHYLLPIIFKVERDHRRATYITGIYTVAALIRNIIIYEVFNA